MLLLSSFSLFLVSKQINKKYILIFVLFFGINPLANADAPSTYLLDLPLQTTIPAPNPNGKILLISTPRAAPGYDTPAIIYFRSAYLIEYYSESRWVDTPARMLLPLLVQNLEATGLFKAVISTTTSPIMGEWRLDTEIIRLQQEFFTEPSQVRLILRAQLLDMETHQIIASQIFQILENTQTQDAAGGVLATHQAISKILKALKEFLKTHY